TGRRLVGLVRHDDTLQHATRHVTLLLLSDLRALGTQNSLDARDVPAYLAHPRRVLELAACLLESQVERLPAQLEQLVLQLVGRLGLEMSVLLGLISSRCRWG